jgi:hypothetical protein
MYVSDTVVMHLLALARTIQADRDREVEAATRHRRLLGGRDMATSTATPPRVAPAAQAPLSRTVPSR